MYKLLLIALVLLSFNAVGQEIRKENLTRKKTLHWDYDKKQPQAIGWEKPR